MKKHSVTRRHFLSATGGLAASSVVIPKAFGQAPAIIGQANKATVRLEWSVTAHHAPWFVGLEKGLFAKNGLDLTVNPGRGSGLTAQAVAAGQETFGFLDASAIPLAVTRGADIRAFYGYIQQTFFGIMFFKNSGIKTAKDLEGKRYGDIPGATSNALFPVFMKLQKADPAKVRVVSVDGAAKTRTFLDRQFEATACSVADDLISLRMQGHDLDAFSYSEMGLNLLGASLIATNDTIRRSPNLIRGLVAGWTEAIKMTAQDHAAAIEIVKKRVPDSPDARAQTAMLPEVLKRLSTQNSAHRPSGFMAEPDWRSTVEILTQGGMLQSGVNVSALYTNDFVA